MQWSFKNVNSALDPTKKSKTSAPNRLARATGINIAGMDVEEC